MRTILRHPRRLTAFCTLLALGLSTAFVVGQENAPPSITVRNANSGETFPIPEDAKTAPELFKFLEELGEVEPQGESEQEMLAHQKKTLRTVVEVSDRALEVAANDQEAIESYYYKLQALRFLQDLGEQQVEDEFEKTVAAALSDERENVVALGMKFRVESGFAKWSVWDDEQKSELIKSISSFVTSSEPDEGQLQMVSAVLDFLGDMEGEQYATQLIDETLPHFKESENPNIQAMIPMLQGIARRMNLPGNTMEVKGTTLDGSEFDMESYRGKVVLVDFWATWCGPCRAEVPNLLEHYNSYHEKGFDIVVISLDETREQAEKYIEQTEIPWVTLFSDKEDERGWDHPLAVHYGITGIPRAILVNREGVVVNMNARGEILGQELRRLLGEPLAHADSQSDEVVQRVAKPVVEE